MKLVLQPNEMILMAGSSQLCQCKGQVNGKLIVKKGQGHFNLEKGPEYKQFPFLLEVLGEK